MAVKTEQLYEGKAKKVFATDDPNLCIVSYKDDATAFDGLKKGSIAGKGVVNNRMSNYLMEKLEKEAGKRKIDTYYPPLVLCTDNAAMIACAGYYEYINGLRGDLKLNAYPALKLGDKFIM